MSALIPSSVTQTIHAPVASATAWRIESTTAAPFSEDRDGPRTRGRANGFEQARAQTILPPDHGESGPRGARRPRAEDNPAYWPTAAFFAQHLSQEALPDDGPPIGPASGAAHYPSLAFDSDIILPGETLSAAVGTPGGIDIIV